jgi:hypothetical protein
MLVLQIDEARERGGGIGIAGTGQPDPHADAGRARPWLGHQVVRELAERPAIAMNDRACSPAIPMFPDALPKFFTRAACVDARQ